MGYNPNAACQFHSLFGVELASKTPTCVDLKAWRGIEVHDQIAITALSLFWRRLERQQVHGIELGEMLVRGVQIERQQTKNQA